MNSQEENQRVAEYDSGAIQEEVTYLRARLETVLNQNLQLRMNFIEKATNSFPYAGEANFPRDLRFQSLADENLELRKRISEIESSEIWKILEFSANQLNALRLTSIVKRIGMRVYRFLLIKGERKAKS